MRYLILKGFWSNLWIADPEIRHESKRTNLVFINADINPLSVNLAKLSNTLKQFVNNLPTNRLIIFEHFMRMVLKWLVSKPTFICYFQHFFHIKVLIHIHWKHCSVFRRYKIGRSTTNRLISKFATWLVFFLGIWLQEHSKFVKNGNINLTRFSVTASLFRSIFYTEVFPFLSWIYGSSYMSVLFLFP